MQTDRRQLPPNKAYDTLVSLLSDRLVTVEHFRVPLLGHGADHFAVAVLADGYCFLGVAELSPKDRNVYSRKFGHQLAVRRALSAAWDYRQGRQTDALLGHLPVWQRPGRERRDEIRGMLEDLCGSPLKAAGLLGVSQ